MTQWDYQSAHAAALKYSSKGEFERSSGGACAWARRNGVLEDITSHMEKCILWDEQSAMAEAKKYNNRMTFQKGSSGCVKWLRRHNLLDKACEHMQPQFRWSCDTVTEEAKRFSSRNEFHEGNPSAAQWATKRGLMENLFPHKLTLWDLDSVAEEALKYSSREEFRTSAAGAAQWAARNGVWDSVCAHMNLGSPCDYDCVYIWKVLGRTDLYKIGVTSKRLGTKRIEHVAGTHGFDVEILHMKHTEDALRKERTMLSFGRPADLGVKDDGFSEFRHLSDKEFCYCLDVMGLQQIEVDL